MNDIQTVNMFDSGNSGGAIAARGFDYQDYCALWLFLEYKNELKSIEFEGCDDIALLFENKRINVQVKRYQFTIAEARKVMKNTNDFYCDQIYIGTGINQEFRALLDKKEEYVNLIKSTDPALRKNTNESFSKLLDKHEFQMDSFLKSSFLELSSDIIESIVKERVRLWVSTENIVCSEEKLLYEILGRFSEARGKRQSFTVDELSNALFPLRLSVQKVPERPYVFLCGREKDYEEINLLLREWNRWGIAYYFVEGKQHYDAQMMHNLENSEILVFLFSKDDTEKPFLESTLPHFKSKVEYLEISSPDCQKDFIEKLYKNYRSVFDAFRFGYMMCRKTVKRVMENYSCSFMDAPDQMKKELGIDAEIVWKEKGKRVDILYVCFNSENAEYNTKNDDNGGDRSAIHLSKPDLIRVKLSEWRNISSPVIMVGTDIKGKKAWWLPLKNPNYIDLNGDEIALKRVHGFHENSYRHIKKLFRNNIDDTSIPEVRMSKQFFKGSMGKECIKSIARTYYADLKKMEIESQIPELSKRVIISRVGWKKITDSSRREDQIIQSFMLLPYVPEILGKATNYTVLHHKTTEKEDGSYFIYQKIGIRVRFISKSRASFLVRLVLARKKEYDSMSELLSEKVWFYNIHEIY